MSGEPKRIAEWMLNEYLKQERLDQYLAAKYIREHFGEMQTYKNNNGNWAISKDILEEFKNIRPADVVWSRGDQIWRKKTDCDKTNGIMVD